MITQGAVSRSGNIPSCCANEFAVCLEFNGRALTKIRLSANIVVIAGPMAPSAQVRRQTGGK